MGLFRDTNPIIVTLVFPLLFKDIRKNLDSEVCKLLKWKEIKICKRVATDTGIVLELILYGVIHYEVPQKWSIFETMNSRLTVFDNI